MEDARQRILENPFYVLGLRPSATRQEIEREGQKILGMIELDLSGADSYATPLGAQERTADMVRRAMADLRDPEKRLVHELWATLEATLIVELEDDEPTLSEGTSYDFADTLSRLGWSER
jgi:hypothetical protein